MLKLRISDFQRGKTQSPYLDGAFWKSANLDIHGQPGIARINYKPTGHVGTGGGEVDDLITDFAALSGTGGKAVFADQNSVKVITGPEATSEAGSASSGAAYYVENWKNYILATGTTTLKATAINANMDNAWTTISSSLENITVHKMLNSLKDGKIYIANDNKIAVLEQDAGQTFDPTDANTFTLSLSALVLEPGHQIESLEDFGRFIAVFVDIKEQGKTGVFLWDRTSLTLDAMYEIKEPRMTRTLEYQNIIYITGGRQGNIYRLTENGLRKYTQIVVDDYDSQNDALSGGLLSYTSLRFQTMAIWKDKLMVAVSVNGSITPAGIYSVKEGVVNHELIVSGGYTDNTLEIGSMLVVDDYLFYGYKKSTEYKLDSVRDDANRLDGYACYFETPFLRVGYKLEKNNIDRVEVVMSRALQTDEGIRIKYRKNIDDSWTTLGTKSYSTDGAQSSLVFPGITNIENLQIRCELTTGASSTNTPYLQEIFLV